MQLRWKKRPVDSNWGDFGADDQLGSMNLVGPDQVKKGLAEVQIGRTFSLSLPLDYPGGNALHPRRHPPRRFATLRGGKNEGEQCFCFAASRDNALFCDVFSDDVVLLHTQYSTQWDGLAHVGAEFDADDDGLDEIVFYNGFQLREHVKPAVRAEGPARWNSYEDPRAEALGIERLAGHGVQGRAVMVDLHRHFGQANHAVTFPELMTIMKEDNVVVEKGDMLCFYTGLDSLILGMKKQPIGDVLLNSCSGLDGSDERLLRWISESGIAALISDNFAVELMPKSAKTSRHAMLPLHHHCLFKNGIHLGELWRLEELAMWLRQHKRNRFLLTAPPLALPGGVGSPVTPIGTV